MEAVQPRMSTGLATAAASTGRFRPGDTQAVATATSTYAVSGDGAADTDTGARTPQVTSRAAINRVRTIGTFDPLRPPMSNPARTARDASVPEVNFEKALPTARCPA